MKGYDYTREVAYFVTICTRGREPVFGAVMKGEVRLNECGREVARSLTWLAQRYSYVRLDEWVVMPDRMHAIIMITNPHHDDAHSDVADLNVTDSNETCRDGSRSAQMPTAPTTGPVGSTTDGTNAVPAQRKPLGRLIGAFKTVSTKRVNDIRSTPGALLWQRNYHERVIRSSFALDALRRYIANNPVLWQP